MCKYCDNDDPEAEYKGICGDCYDRFEAAALADIEKELNDAK